MQDKEWLSKVRLAKDVYNEKRMAKDFQKDEIERFIQWLYYQYGIEYKPQPKD